ncbi:MAG: tyrosine-type recombinase/integrase [Acidimicrobiales bacterium]
MGWKATGHPTVRKQRDKWVVRVDGIDTETGNQRPRQLGTYPSQRSALKAARSTPVQELVVTRDTVSWLVRRYVASRTDVTLKAREQYEWAIPHIEAGLGAIRLDRLDREDVARWLDDLAMAGRLSWRSIQICRTVLRAALADAVEEGLLRRSPAARVPMPRAVAKPPKQKEVDAWTENQVAQFLALTAGHRWAVAFCLGALYGLRRSEVLALKWDDLDTKNGTLRIDEGLVAVRQGAAWSNAKNARSRRVIPLDDETLRLLARHRKAQTEERLAAGPTWEDYHLIIATHAGRPVMPRSLDRALDLLIAEAGLPRLTSHGLRHTAATHMVRGARDVGELRAVADLLGHSPDMLMKTYAHALPESTRAVADRIGARRASRKS